MDLTRRQIAFVFAGLYSAGGLLLLHDYVAAPAQAGAHLPLALHVFPVSVAASLIALLTGQSAPLDPLWYVPAAAVSAAFAVSLLFCAAALFNAVSGGAAASNASSAGNESSGSGEKDWPN